MFRSLKALKRFNPRCIATNRRGSLSWLEQLFTKMSQFEVFQPELFTVFVRDVRFVLTRQQVEKEGPESYFAAAFLRGHWTESESKTITLYQQNPKIFEVIVDYLSGYQVFPLSVPVEEQEKWLGNLKHDATYLQLSGLLVEIQTAGAYEELVLLGPYEFQRHGMGKILAREQKGSR
jgi:hypothetical protein